MRTAEFNTTTHYEDVLPLVLDLPPLDKFKLVQQIMSTLSNEYAQRNIVQRNIVPAQLPSQADHVTRQESWGVRTLAMLDALDTSEWEALEMPDVVTWLKAQRHIQDERRGLDFDNPGEL
jgi:hypothetical protein